MRLNTTVEGAYPDTPHKTLVCGIELEIPQNAQVLSIGQRGHYVFYGVSKTFSDFNVVKDRYFEDYDACKNSVQGGWPLKDYCPNINWIFDAQRSFLTRDGRLFVDILFFHKDWRWYLNRVGDILKFGKMIFEADSNDVEGLPNE